MEIERETKDLSHLYLDSQEYSITSNGYHFEFWREQWNEMSPFSEIAIVHCFDGRKGALIFNRTAKVEEAKLVQSDINYCKAYVLHNLDDDGEVIGVIIYDSIKKEIISSVNIPGKEKEIQSVTINVNYY